MRAGQGLERVRVTDSYSNVVYFVRMFIHSAPRSDFRLESSQRVQSTEFTEFKSVASSHTSAALCPAQ